MTEGDSGRDLAAPRDLSHEERAKALLELAGELQRLLVPVRPATAARQRIHSEVVAQARRHHPGRAAHMAQQTRWAIWIAAAAIGSLASIVGVVLAIVQRNKHARSTHAA